MCVAAYQTDFSVTNRLLPPAYSRNGSSSSSSSSSSLQAATGALPYRAGTSYSPKRISSIPGWQNLLPTDQGGIPSKCYQQPGWRTSVPNVSLPQDTTYQSVGYGASGSAYHSSHSPDSSTGAMVQHVAKETKDWGENGAVVKEKSGKFLLT